MRRLRPSPVACAACLPMHSCITDGPCIRKLRSEICIFSAQPSCERSPLWQPRALVAYATSRSLSWRLPAQPSSSPSRSAPPRLLVAPPHLVWASHAHGHLAQTPHLLAGLGPIKPSRPHSCVPPTAPLSRGPASNP